MDDCILNKRRSVRKFKCDSVSNELISKVISSARQSPSARNQQPWRFVVVKNKQMLKDLSKVSKYSAFLESAPAVIAILKVSDDLLSTPDMAVQDLSCCMTYKMLEATSLGLGTCYMGIWPRQERISACNKALNLKDGLNTFALMPIGYPQDENAFYEKEGRFNKDFIKWEE